MKFIRCLIVCSIPLAGTAACGGHDSGGTCGILSPADLGFEPLAAEEGRVSAVVGPEIDATSCALLDRNGNGVLVTLERISDPEVLLSAAVQLDLSFGSDKAKVGSDGIARFAIDSTLGSVAPQGSGYTDADVQRLADLAIVSLQAR